MWEIELELAARCDRSPSTDSQTIFISFWIVQEDCFRETASFQICSFPWGNELERAFSDDISKSARHIEYWILSSGATYVTNQRKFCARLKLGGGVSPSSRGAPPLVAGVCWIYYMLIFTCGIRRFAITTRIILKSLPWLKIFDFLFEPEQERGGDNFIFDDFRGWQNEIGLCCASAR